MSERSLIDQVTARDGTLDFFLTVGMGNRALGRWCSRYRFPFIMHTIHVANNNLTRSARAQRPNSNDSPKAKLKCKNQMAVHHAVLTCSPTAHIETEPSRTITRQASSSSPLGISDTLGTLPLHPPLTHSRPATNRRHRSNRSDHSARRRNQTRIHRPISIGSTCRRRRRRSHRKQRGRVQHTRHRRIRTSVDRLDGVAV